MSSASVLIPAYNAEKWIEAAIVSAQTQTVRPLEIIVASDGSTDRTVEISQRCGAQVLELPKSNGAVARNRAVEVANGERLFFLDADDLWLPKKIERHFILAKEIGDILILDRTQAFGIDGQDLYWQGGLAEAKMLIWQDLLSHRAWPSGSGFSIPKSTYLAVEGFNEELIRFQDVDFWIRVVEKYGGYSSGEILTRYRVGDGSVSRRSDRHYENLQRVLDSWTFANAREKRQFRRVASLMVAETSAWPQAAKYLWESGLPITNRYFWKCVLVSLRRSFSKVN